MSTLSVTTIKTSDGLKNLTLTTGNTSSGNIVLNSDGGMTFTSTSTVNAIAIAANGNIGIGPTTNTSLPLSIDGSAHPRALTINSSNTSGVFLSLKPTYGNSTVASFSGINNYNEADAAVATQLNSINADGSSAIIWSTQVAGDRTDRRVERLRIDSSGNLDAASNTFNLGTALLVANNGYSRLPNGLLMQWGSGAAANTTTAAQTFPIAYTTLYSVTVSGVGSTGTAPAGVTAANATTFTPRSSSTANPGTVYYWSAIGIA